MKSPNVQLTSTNDASLPLIHGGEHARSVSPRASPDLSLASLTRFDSGHRACSSAYPRRVSRFFPTATNTDGTTEACSPSKTASSGPSFVGGRTLSMKSPNIQLTSTNDATMPVLHDGEKYGFQMAITREESAHSGATGSPPYHHARSVSPRACPDLSLASLTRFDSGLRASSSAYPRRVSRFFPTVTSSDPASLELNGCEFNTFSSVSVSTPAMLNHPSTDIGCSKLANTAVAASDTSLVKGSTDIASGSASKVSTGGPGRVTSLENPNRTTTPVKLGLNNNAVLRDATKHAFLGIPTADVRKARKGFVDRSEEHRKLREMLAEHDPAAAFRPVSRLPTTRSSGRIPQVPGDPSVPTTGPSGGPSRSSHEHLNQGMKECDMNMMAIGAGGDDESKEKHIHGSFIHHTAASALVHEKWSPEQ
jgi:hypothetical protein